jgi:HAD superfamily hydrolase (TIGR01509 family)
MELIKPKAVVFDLGKVLLGFDYRLATDKLAGHGKALVKDLSLFTATSSLLVRYETGLLTRQQFYDEVCAATGFGGNLEEFGTCFADIFWEIEPMVRLQATLRKQGVPTFIFSNTNELAVAHIRKNFPFFAHFDGYILSYEHGSMKPEARLYEVVEEQCGRRGSELLYLDDRPENIAAGQARGWQVILHEDPVATRAAVERLGLLKRS